MRHLIINLNCCCVFSRDIRFYLCLQMNEQSCLIVLYIYWEHKRLLVLSAFIQWYASEITWAVITVITRGIEGNGCIYTSATVASTSCLPPWGKKQLKTRESDHNPNHFIFIMYINDICADVFLCRMKHRLEASYSKLGWFHLPDRRTVRSIELCSKYTCHTILSEPYTERKWQKTH